MLAVARKLAAGSAGSPSGTGSAAATTAGVSGAGHRSASAPNTARSPLNTVDSAGLGVPSWWASTSRSTPTTCPAISVADANRRSSSIAVARRSNLRNESQVASTGTSAASGSVCLNRPR